MLQFGHAKSHVGRAEDDQHGVRSREIRGISQELFEGCFLPTSQCGSQGDGVNPKD